MCSPCPARMVAEDFSMSRELHRPLRPPGGGDIAISIRTKCDAGGIAHKRCHLCAFETPVDRFERRGQVCDICSHTGKISSTSQLPPTLSEQAEYCLHSRLTSRLRRYFDSGRFQCNRSRRVRRRVWPGSKRLRPSRPGRGGFPRGRL